MSRHTMQINQLDTPRVPDYHELMLIAGQHLHTKCYITACDAWYLSRLLFKPIDNVKILIINH